MIALIVLLFAAVWLFVAGAVVRVMARFILSGNSATALALVLYPIVLVLPFIDEVIGRRQFQELCEREAKVWIAADAKDVVAARRGEDGFPDRNGFWIPIQEQPINYVNSSTGKSFYTAKAFHTPGGWIMRAGLNLGSSKSCWPPAWSPHEHGIDIDKLLEQGKALGAGQLR